MSFEGFYRKICKNGHLSERNIFDKELIICPVCRSKFEFEEVIDETNGADKAYCTPLDVIGEEKIKKQDGTGNSYSINVKLYKAKIGAKKVKFFGVTKC